MKNLFEFTLAGLLFLSVFSAPVIAGGDSIKVLTRNQYLGADLTPVVLARTEEQFRAAAEDALNQIAENYFPLRARRLATEIALTEPDVIGLQEVFNFTVNGSNIGPPFVDHLAETLDALAAKGQSYDAVAKVEHLDIEIDIDINGDGIEEKVRVLDRDVILVREGVDFRPLSGNFATDGLCGVPIPITVPGFPPTLMSTESEDGCNYSVVVQVPSPLGPDPITIERGFVGVDVTVRGKDYRVVNTHLEQNLPSPDPNSAIFQSLQAVELVGTLQFTTPPGLPLILLGDFNSSPEHAPIGSIIPPYQIITSDDFDMSFADIWDTNRFALFDPGYTCCQEADLSNRRSILDERIDIIFVRDTSFLSWAFVMGRVPIFPLSWPPNWASDHGGVFGKLIFRQGEMDWRSNRKRGRP
jgi:endonuclease/exonuclease/phosphatase family metal-dependent hydrolase